MKRNLIHYLPLILPKITNPTHTIPSHWLKTSFNINFPLNSISVFHDHYFLQSFSQNSVGISILFHACHKSLPAILLYLAKRNNINIHIMYFMNLLLGLTPLSSFHIHPYEPCFRAPLICILPLMLETKFYIRKETGKTVVLFIVIFMLYNNNGGDNRSGKWSWQAISWFKLLLISPTSPPWAKKF
jgi:hypothetical protein